MKSLSLSTGFRSKLSRVRESANKSHTFSVGYKTTRYAKASAVKCLDLFKLADKVDGRFRTHLAGLAEQLNHFVNDLRQATSMPVIIASCFNCSVSLSRIRLVGRFPCVIMLIYSSLLSAEETAPSMSFLEFLGQEEHESWIEPALELSDDSTNESEQIEDRSAEEDSNETN